MAELRSLIDSEPERMGVLESELAKFWRMQEIKIRPRYRDREIVEGHWNTAYFHVV